MAGTGREEVELLVCVPVMSLTVTRLSESPRLRVMVTGCWSHSLELRSLDQAVASGAECSPKYHHQPILVSPAG